MAMAIGVVTDFSAIEAKSAAGRGESGGGADGGGHRGQRAGDQRDGDRYGRALDPYPVLDQRDGRAVAGPSRKWTNWAPSK